MDEIIIPNIENYTQEIINGTLIITPKEKYTMNLNTQSTSELFNEVIDSYFEIKKLKQNKASAELISAAFNKYTKGQTKYKSITGNYIPLCKTGNKC